MIAGVAALVTATGGTIGVLYQTGAIGHHSDGAGATPPGSGASQPLAGHHPDAVAVAEPREHLLAGPASSPTPAPSPSPGSTPSPNPTPSHGLFGY